MDAIMGQPYPKGFIGQLYTPRSVGGSVFGLPVIRPQGPMVSA